MVINNRLRTINIRKRTPQEWLVFTFFIMPFALAFLTEILGLPSFIRYLMDLLVVGLSVMLFANRYFVISTKAKPMLTLAALFFLYTLIVYLLNFQSPFYFLWGARNTFRFYLAFLIFIAYVSQEEAFSWLKLLDILFWLHFVVTVFQFVVIKPHQDRLGGIFGVSSPTSGYVLLFFCVVIGKSLLQAFDGKEQYTLCIIKCLVSLLLAAMAEIKFYYFAFVVILILTAGLTRFSKGKIALIVAAAFGIVIGSTLLTLWFDSFDGFLSWERLWEAATKNNYASGNDLNRLSAIFTLMNKYITGSVQQIFGMGLGNCDTSDISIFNSVFYQRYSYLHYGWFSSAMLFLETGFVGLVIYLTFFVLGIAYSARQLRRNIGNTLFNRMAIVMSVMCIAITFYNASLRVESGYMAYFVLALPFLDREEEDRASCEAA